MRISVSTRTQLSRAYRAFGGGMRINGILLIFYAESNKESAEAQLLTPFLLFEEI
jgi:hypothetical protein